MSDGFDDKLAEPRNGPEGALVDEATAATQAKAPRAGDGGLAVPVVWGIAAALSVAVLARGAIAGGVLVVMALLAFGLVVLSSRLRHRRTIRVAAPRKRRKARQPSAAMRKAAMGAEVAASTGKAPPGGQIAAWTADEAVRMDAATGSNAGGGGKQDWIGQAERLALGLPEDTDGDASAKQG